MSFRNAQNICFWGSFKTIFQEASYGYGKFWQIFIKIVFNTLGHFRRRWFLLLHSKCTESWKMPFSNGQNIRVLPFCFETIFWNAYHQQLWIQRLLNALSCFYSKRVQLHGSKMCKKLKIGFFKSSVLHLLLT